MAPNRVDSVPRAPPVPMRTLIERFDWSRTSLGTRDAWPETLKTAVRIALDSRFPMGLLWGPDRVQLYNDAYIPIFGSKHPASLGQRAEECWTDLWELIGPMFDAVERTGEANYLVNQLMLIEKSGLTEECYFTFSYSPLRDPSGTTVGIFVAALETTSGVLAERRQSTLQQMAHAIPSSGTAEEMLARCSAPLAINAADVPWWRVYEQPPGPGTVRLVASHGAGPPFNPSAEQLAATKPVRLTGDDAPGGDVMLLPFSAPGDEKRHGLLVAGLSPARPWDAGYAYFLGQAAEQLGTALGRAHTVELLEHERNALLESMTDAFYALDREFRVTYLNEAAAKHVGKPRAQLLGRRLFEFSPQLEGSELHQRYSAALRDQQPVHFETSVGSPPRPIEIHAYPSPQGLSIFFRDVSLRHQAEEKVRQSERRYRQLFESSPLPTWLYDLQTLRFLEVNEAAVQVYGYSREEFLAMTLADIRPPGEVPKLRAAVAATSDRRGGGVFLHRYKDGSVHQVEISSYALDMAQGTVRLVVAKDISEQVTAQERLAEAHRFTSTLIRTAPVAIVTTDRNLRVSSWNPAAERLFGWREDEVLGRPLPFFCPDDAPKLLASIARELESGVTVSSAEHRRCRRDGTPVDVLVSSELLRDGQGRVTGRVVFMNDLSERKLLEEQFRQAQKMEAVGQLAGGIAHDFNNLLSVILVNLRMLAAELPPDSDAQLAARDADEAAVRATGLTRQLLAFSRRERQVLDTFEANELVTEAERMLRRLIRADIRLETRLHPQAGCVRADRAHLEQVLVNLVVNARDAMPEGGALTIETAPFTGSPQNEGLPPGPYVQLVVRDTGCGMDEPTRRHLFEPFFTTKPVGQGTGLGLAIVYGIVRQSGGAISVESTRGHGTTFTLVLPAVAREEPKPAEGLVEDPLPVGTETLLIVEDEPAVRASLKRLLERHGYTVREAGDGLDALEAMERHGAEIALVLTDLVMPRLGGRALAARLGERKRPVPILFMSGYDREGVESGLHDLASVELRKPFDPAAVLRKVRAALDALRQDAR